MKLIRRPSSTHHAQARAITLGNFDGVHLGHQALFKELTTLARKQSLLATAIRFWPHPREFFQSDFAFPHIATLWDDVYQMALLGLDELCLMHFDAPLANMTAQDFINNLLVKSLNAKHIWVGDDFRFGHKRQGDITLLKSEGLRHGFTVQAMPSVCNAQGLRISSSMIRAALQAGDIATATANLGHPLVYTGHVCHGRKLGRTLGFPTLNLPLTGRACALKGVLAVWVHGLAPKPLPAVASLGVRPTVEESCQWILETHIPNWQGNAYGKRVHIEVTQHLRTELRFEQLNDMVQQMHSDTQEALRILQTQGPQFNCKAGQNTVSVQPFPNP